MALDKVKDDMLQDNLVFPGSTTQFPSITTTQRDALTPVVGMVIYNSTIGNLQQYTSTGWASIAAPPAISSLTYPTESGAVLTALDATGSSDAAQTLIINGSNFTGTVTVEILVGGTYSAFSSSVSVNGARNQVTCTGVTKRAAADNYTLKVTNTTGLDATTTVNFSADPSFSTAANLGTVYAGATLSKSIAFTGTAVLQGATAKPTWMTVTGNAPSGSDANGAGATAFLATGSPATLGGTIANSGTSQTHTFSIIVRDAENQTFNRDFSLTAVDFAAGGTLSTYTSGGTTYRVNKFDYTGSNQTLTLYSAVTADILVVAGGGGGGAGAPGNDGGGGGGAGGLLTFTSQSLSAGDYTIVVGGGGAGGVYSSNTAPYVFAGTSGGNSRFGTLTEVIGGGGGGVPGGVSSALSGGSGGGGGGSGGSTRTGGSGTAGQGNAGASNSDLRQTYSLSGSGGGGAGSAGEAQTAAGTGRGSNGGAGVNNDYLTGSNITYAGGGGGAGGTGGSPGQVPGGSGGGGGGGNGGANGSSNAEDGTDGLGGGGGGGANNSTGGGDGGNGVVIIRYAI